MISSPLSRPGEITPGAYLTGPFAPVVAEVDVADLEVTGELPTDLEGVYVRNGPNPRFTPIGGYLYPLDGDGMLHRVTISEGRVRYDNKFVRTPMVVAEEKAGRALWPGLNSGYRPGADDVGPVLAGTRRELPDINVVRHAGQLLALAECDRPYRIGPALETRERESFDGALPAGICAHPKIDPVTGEMLVFCYNFRPPFLTWSTIAADGTASTPAAVDGVERPVMIHDMAITERYVVLVVAPLYFELPAVVTGGAPLSWCPEDGTRIALVPRDGAPVRWVTDEAFWMWHAVNAHDAPDGSVVLDYVEWASPGLGVPVPGAPHLTRALLDPAAGSIRRTVLDDADLELCRVDDRMLGRAHRTAAFALRTGRPQPHRECHDGLAWHDTTTGALARWTPQDTAVGEPVFAPDPRSSAPDAGWWLTFTTRISTGASALVIIPAADPATGPVATVRMPVRVPLGLHGSWIPN